MAGSIRVVAPDGAQYIPETSIITKGLPQDKSPDIYLERLKTEISTNLWDEIVFYNENSRRCVLARFKELPDRVKEAMEKGQEVKLAGVEGDFRQVHVDDEPIEYDVAGVKVEGLGPKDDKLRKDIIEAFDYEEGDDIDLEELMDAVKDVMKKTPVEVLDVPLKKTGDNKIEIIIQVKKLPNGLLVEGLPEDDPLLMKIKKKFEGQYLRPVLDESNGLDFELPDGTRAMKFVMEEMEKAPSYYYLKPLGNAGNRLVYISENISGNLVIRLERIETLADVKLSGDEADDVKKLFGQPPYTKEMVRKGLKDIHKYFAKKGKIVKVDSIHFEFSPLDETLAINVSYQTQDIPKKIIIDGDLPIDLAAVQEIIGKPASQEGYTYPEIEEGMARLISYLVDEGYQPKPDPDRPPMDIKDGVVIIHLSMARLKGYDVQLIGENSIDKEVVTRQFEDKPGDFFNLKRFKRGLARVQMTGQFSTIDYKISDDGDVTPIVFAEPTPPRALRGALGYNSGFAAELALRLKRINKEESIGIQGMYSSWHQYGQLTFSDPWFFGGRRSLAVSLRGRHWNWGQHIWEAGLDTIFGIPLGGTFSPWMLYAGLDVSYIKYLTDRPDGTTWFPMVISPSLTAGYFTVRRVVSATVSGSVGMVNYPELKARWWESIPLFWEVDLELAASGGHKFADKLPIFSRYNIFSTPIIYGQGMADMDNGLSFTHLSAKLSWDYKQYIAFKLGVTAGGVGNHTTDMQKVGLGGEIIIPVLGLTIATGYAFDFYHNTRRFGIVLRAGGGPL